MFGKSPRLVARSAELKGSPTTRCAGSAVVTQSLAQFSSTRGGTLKLEGVLGMAAALVGIAGLVLIAPGPERNTEEPLRRGWTVGLVLVGLAFFWIGLLGVLD